MPEFEWKFSEPAQKNHCGDRSSVVRSSRKPYPGPACCCCVGPAGPIGPTGPTGETGPTAPYLSSYMEALGNTQTVATGADIAFNVQDEDALDIAGIDIELDASGKVFTLTRPGLYLVKWSVNLAEGSTPPIIIGLTEMGSPSSALANAATSGAFSSSALIQVGEDEVPYAVTLRNFGGPVGITEPAGVENIAVSISILRFADGPNG